MPVTAPDLPPTLRRLLLTAAALLVVCAIALVDHGIALALAPALVLVALLAVGVFPGEPALARLARRVARCGRRPGREPRRVLRHVAERRPSGIASAFALAVRPPPAATSPA